MQITSNFEGGSASVVAAADPKDIRIRLVPDRNSGLYQWFYFCLDTQPGAAHCVKIIDLKGSAYPEGWSGYQAVASYDRQAWFCVPTTFDGDTLTIPLIPARSPIFLAYTTPYPFDRHLERLQAAQHSPAARSARSVRAWRVGPSTC
jgi:murein tripeptide amidase MpaA